MSNDSPLHYCCFRIQEKQRFFGIQVVLYYILPRWVVAVYTQMEWEIGEVRGTELPLRLMNISTEGFSSTSTARHLHPLLDVTSRR